MNRKIKFIAWDKDHKHMNRWEEVRRWSFKSYEQDSIELLQYTGLKDKDGTEIYEGDIVQLPYITPLGDVCWNGIKEPERYRYSVVYAHGSFCISRLHGNKPLVDYCKKEKGEYIGNYGNKIIIDDVIEAKVIGNIFEGKNLLEVGDE